MKTLHSILLLNFYFGILVVNVGCRGDFSESPESYNWIAFERGVVESLDEKGFSAVEAWVSAEHLMPIPDDIVALHGDFDQEKARLTGYLITERETEEIVAVRYWVLGGRVAAITLFATQEEMVSIIQSDLAKRFPGIQIDIDIRDNAHGIRNAVYRDGTSDPDG